MGEELVPITSSPTSLTDSRYERKFNAGILHLSEVYNALKKHPMLFREIFEERKINNIYFDKPDYDFYWQNKNGVSHRKKYRLRWYGETLGSIAKSNLEVKAKYGLVGDKLVYPLGSFTMDSSFNRSLIEELVSTSEGTHPFIKEEFKGLQPTLLNSYSRTYFMSANGKFRVTVDFNQNFHQLIIGKSIIPYPHQIKEVIVELKYAVEDDALANTVSQAFPFRLSKSSKYVNGIDTIRHIQD